MRRNYKWNHQNFWMLTLLIHIYLSCNWRSPINTVLQNDNSDFIHLHVIWWNSWWRERSHTRILQILTKSFWILYQNKDDKNNSKKSKLTICIFETHAFDFALVWLAKWRNHYQLPRISKRICLHSQKAVHIGRSVKVIGQIHSFIHSFIPEKGYPYVQNVSEQTFIDRNGKTYPKEAVFTSLQSTSARLPTHVHILPKLTLEP